MEASNRARKGFTKGKLVMSFYRAAKPQSTSSTVQYNNSSNSNSGVVINHDKYVAAQPRLHKVSEISALDDSSYTTTTFENNHHYGVVAGDESVDLKAASYISYVQERFRLDWVNSERKMTQEMQY
ncbi:hypothetical protein ACSBR2_022478 [Camellia fascicularis]